MDVHELTAGYALDALDPGEHARYEEHLASCEPCREELQSFWSVSGSLAQAAGGPAPPAALRERILEQARSERTNVVPLQRRHVPRALSAVAAIAAVAAIGLGIWATSLSRDLGRAEDQIAILEDPNARTVATAGGEADLVVTPAGEAALVVRKLAPAPKGKDYEIWVFENGVPKAAGIFEEPGVAMLSRRVEPGQTVAVTLEPDGGVDAPTGAPLFTAHIRLTDTPLPGKDRGTIRVAPRCAAASTAAGWTHARPRPRSSADAALRPAPDPARDPERAASAACPSLAARAEPPRVRSHAGRAGQAPRD